jgi:hypothetical protein
MQDILLFFIPVTGRVTSSCIPLGTCAPDHARCWNHTPFSSDTFNLKFAENLAWPQCNGRESTALLLLFIHS